MNCKDYEAAIAADPAGTFEGAGHAVNCADCASLTEQIRALDARIAKALEIPVPELKLPDLYAIDDESNVVSLPFRRRLSTPVWLGLAASMVLATVLGVQFLQQETGQSSLGAEIMAHLDHESMALKVTNRAVSEQRLAEVLKDDVSQMDTEVGLVTYAMTCIINGKEIPHLVIQGERGPVTLLLLPDEKISAAVSLEGDGTQGVILPLGNGSIAIVGERGERLGEVQQRLVDSVKWSRT